MKLLSVIRSLLDRFCVVMGAFLGSQIPEFMEQYTHRLAGHVDELQRLLDQLRQVASYSNKTLEQYIHKFITSSDPDFVLQGEFMHGMLARWDELQQAYIHLTQSPIWVRPYAFLTELQSDIAQSTLTTFQPGINFTVEGFCYTAVGLLFGWLLYKMISKCFLFGYSRASAILKQNA